MALSAGDRLGPYEILVPLGAGGMGEVYRAKDTRLDRIVAVKVLPSDLSSRPSLRQRLEREAKAISQLSHPHICTLHDVGREGETAFLVMEHLEGESLADRLGRGRVPLDQALRHGAEIADALHHAHRHGVVHRDLKPGNVMLTKSGAKLLDFGLAKMHEEPVAGEESESSLPTMNPPLTEEGVILGTYPYMAPEQLEGRPTDTRTDLFALGVILYEMVTGERPFQGESRASLIAAIMTSQPRPMGEIDALSPPSLDRVVRRCLEKDPDERWQSAADLGAELGWIRGADSEEGSPRAAPERRSGARTVWIGVGAIGLVVAGILLGLTLGGRTGSGREQTVRTARQQTFLSGEERQPALSPEGRVLAYVSHAAGNADIYLQRTNGRNALNLTRDSPAADYSPSFSPDGDLIAFRSEREGGGIFIMGATGESVRRVSDLGHNPSWSADGRELVVSTEGVEGPLNRQANAELWTIDVATGEKRRIYSGDAVQPAWSPDGARIAFWEVRGNSGQRDLATIDPEGLEEPVPVTSDVAVDWGPVWSSDGRSLYFVSDRAGTMDVWQVWLDPATGLPEGEPSLLGVPAERVAWLTVARGTGSLAYVSQSAQHSIYSLTLDPEGLRLTRGTRSIYAGALGVRYPQPSPDGTLIALTTQGGTEDLYVLSADGSELRQLTDDPFRDRGPRWAPDGSEIAFYSNRSGTFQVWGVRPDGSGLRQMSNDDDGAWFPSWSPDGRRIAHPTGRTTCIVKLDDEATSPSECLPTPSEDRWFEVADWSPDGRWLVGNQSVRAGPSLPEMLLWSFDRAEYQPIQEGGFVARWLPDSRHLLLLNERGHLVVVDRSTGDVRDLGAIETRGQPDPWSLGLSHDGRTVVVQSTAIESNVWLLSLADAAGDES